MQIYANVMQKNQHDETLEYAFLMKSYNVGWKTVAYI